MIPIERTEASGPPSWVRLGVLFLTVFVDLVGFGIVLPLLPIYADRFGASGTTIGVLVLSYSAAQFALTPIWGRLSDRFGRRPILIVGLLGSAASYMIFAYADSVVVLLLSRIAAGIGGANIPVAQAYIADVTPPAKRAGQMGLIGAAFGLGFIFGPAIGGVLAPIAPELPGLAAAGLCLTNALVAMALLPESLPRDQRGGARIVHGPGRVRTAAEVAGSDVTDASDAVYLAGGTSTRPHLAEIASVLRHPGFRDVLVLSFIFTTAFSMMHPTFPLFAAQRFGLTERDVGWLFAYIGVISAVMQGGLVRFLVGRVGEVALIRVCAIPFVVGFGVIAIATSIPVLLAGLALLAVGFGGTLPSLVSLLSQSAPEELQGGSLGMGQSASALARIAGPLGAGLLWDGLGTQWPYFAAAGIGAVAALWGLRLIQPRHARTS